MLLFTIWVTEKCNLRCTYCYENKTINRETEMDDDIKNVITFIDFFANKYIDDEIFVSFHGGEPLLKIALIKQYVKSMQKIYGDRIQFGITTNGTLLTDETAIFLTQNFSDFSISIDGMQMSHDKNRKFISGNGSYDCIFRNIEKYHIDKSKIRIRMTITADTSRYFKSNVRGLLDYGFCYIVPIIAANDNGWTKERFCQLQKDLEEMIKEKRSKLAFIERLIEEKHVLSKCTGGIKTFNISVDKQVYPCEYVVGINYFSMGTVDSPNNIMEQGERLKLLYDSPNDGHCRECSYSGYCEAVRCKYYNYLNNNHLLKPNENQCSIEHIKYKVWKKYGEQFIK